MVPDSPATRRATISIVVILGLVSLALLLRAVAYYWGDGPHDGEDLPSFLTFLASAAVLLVAVLIGLVGGLRRRNQCLHWLVVSGVLLALAFAWWWLNVMLEQWAS